MFVSEDIEAEVGKRLVWRGEGAERYLWFDSSDSGKDLSFALQAAFDKEVRTQPEGSVLVLADFENGHHETALTQRWKECWAEHDKRVHKIACLGVVGTMKVVFAAYRFFVRLQGVDIDAKMRLFEEEEEALSWLRQG